MTLQAKVAREAPAETAPRLVLDGIGKSFPGRARAARCQPVPLSRPSHRPDRRERGGQVDAGEDPYRHLPAGRRRDPLGGQPVTFGAH